MAANFSHFLDRITECLRLAESAMAPEIRSLWLAVAARYGTLMEAEAGRLSAA